jgi:exopolysaccharide biosynthesis protein
MKRTALVLAFMIAAALTLAAQTAHYPSYSKDSLALTQASWTVMELDKGAEAMYTQVDMFDSRQSISVIRYPARRFRTGFGHYPEKEAGKTSELAIRAGAKMAINGGYFAKGPVPCVYFRIEDEVFSTTTPKEAQLRVNAVVGFKDKKGRKMMIRKCDPTDYDEVAGKWHSVMATGPLLMENDSIVVPVSYSKAFPEKNTGSFYDGRNPRSAIGTDGKGNIYMIVIDGRHKGEADGTTIFQTALICELLGLTEAINLDGGGSSALWSSITGTINYPSDNKTFDHKGERKIPNIIGVF